MAKTIKFSNDGYIDPERVKSAVYNRIDFELPEDLWHKIDEAFADCWNNVIGLRGWVHEDQIENHIYKSLKEQQIIFDYAKIKTIVKIIYDYISITGGYLDD